MRKVFRFKPVVSVLLTFSTQWRIRHIPSVITFRFSYIYSWMRELKSGSQNVYLGSTLGNIYSKYAGVYHGKHMHLIRLVNDKVHFRLLYPPHNEVVGGVYWFHSVRPSVRLSVRPSVRPSVPHAVSALYHLQLWMDSFHIRHK